MALKAIWCTPHAYHSVARLGAHHLAARLAARGWETVFLTNPISPLHALKWRDHDMSLRLSQAGRGMAWESRGLRSLLPVTMLPLVGRLGGRSRWVLDHWPAFTVPNIVRTLREAGFDRPDLMVIDGPIGAPLVDILRPRRSVLRLLDRLGGFASTTPAMLAAMTDLARRVDLVTYSALDLVGDVETLGARRTLHLPNGADVAHFAEPRAQPAIYGSIAEPRAVYVGAMAEWFDFDLVAMVARQRPNISFVLIGSQELARRSLPELPNLHLLGPLPWADLPAFLQHAAIGLIPFDIRHHRDLVNGVNPLKLYEYAAAGLPIVSVAWPELRKLAAPIALADTPEDFLRAIDCTLAAPPSGGTLKSFVAQHDWGQALDRLLTAVELQGEAAPSVPDPVASPI